MIIQKHFYKKYIGIKFCGEEVYRDKGLQKPNTA